MKLKMIRDLDIFGQGIKWRLMSRDSFKSMFGAFITLFLTAIFAVKIYYFVTKVNEYGFAENKVSNQFSGDSQFLNMSDFKLIFYSDITTNESSPTNDILYNTSLSDFFDIIAVSPFDEPNAELWPTEVDCVKTKKFDFMNEFIPEEQKIYKCVQFRENQTSLTILKNNTLFSQNKNTTTNFQFSSFLQFGLRLVLKQPFIDKLKSSTSRIFINILLSNFRVNPIDYGIEEYASFIFIPIDLNFETLTEVSFKKLSVNKKVEFDIFDYEVGRDHKYQIEESTIKTVKSFRTPGKYTETIYFSHYIFEQINEVTYFTLDDILAVMGGFLQVFLSLADFVAGMYNESLVERVLTHYCMEKVSKYDKILSHVKNNVQIQMAFYDKTMQKRRSMIENNDEANKDVLKGYLNKYDNNNNDQTLNNGKTNMDNLNENDVTGLNKGHDHYKNLNSRKNIKDKINDINEKTKVNFLGEFIHEEYVDKEKKISDKMYAKSPTAEQEKGNGNSKDSFDKENIYDINQIEDEFSSKEYASNNHLIAGKNLADEKTLINTRFNKSKDINDFNDLYKDSFISKKNNAEKKTNLSVQFIEDKKAPNHLGSLNTEENQNVEMKSLNPYKNSRGNEALPNKGNYDEINKINEDQNLVNSQNFNYLLKKQLKSQKTQRSFPTRFFNNVASAIFTSVNGKKREYFNSEFDYMEFISIEKYMKLLSGFEAFKFYYFNELNKFNFECISDLFIYSEGYNIKLKENKFILSEDTIPLDPKQRKFFEEFLEHIIKY